MRMLLRGAGSCDYWYENVCEEDVGNPSRTQSHPLSSRPCVVFGWNIFPIFIHGFFLLSPTHWVNCLLFSDTFKCSSSAILIFPSDTYIRSVKFKLKCTAWERRFLRKSTTDRLHCFKNMISPWDESESECYVSCFSFYFIHKIEAHFDDERNFPSLARIFIFTTSTNISHFFLSLTHFMLACWPHASVQRIPSENCTREKTTELNESCSWAATREDLRNYQLKLSVSYKRPKNRKERKLKRNLSALRREFDKFKWIMKASHYLGTVESLPAL